MLLAVMRIMSLWIIINNEKGTHRAANGQHRRRYNQTSAARFQRKAQEQQQNSHVPHPTQRYSHKYSNLMSTHSLPEGSNEQHPPMSTLWSI